jgi:hypothetical protein
MLRGPSGKTTGGSAVLATGRDDENAALRHHRMQRGVVHRNDSVNTLAHSGTLAGAGGARISR